MDISSINTEIEAAVREQLQLVAGDDGAVERAAGALLAALRPALSVAGMQLAEQAATEVAAQLEGFAVDVVVRDGEPTLVVRNESGTDPVSFADDLEARMTVRLPSTLKQEIESAAGIDGDSINAYVIKALSSKAGRRKAGRRMTGTINT